MSAQHRRDPDSDECREMTLMNEREVFALRMQEKQRNGTLDDDESDCDNCDGFGRVWNNADPTSGQFSQCQCCMDKRRVP